ncbi:MAG TPA: HAD family hydrolase [Solirubrobacteraceae bacterium]|nr:HAD family hydrolase [Solirubrobacteraceae bacterium]
MAARAVFLDRDGTLNHPAAPGDYITEPRGLRLFDGAAQAVALLRSLGYLCVVVSNQRGVSLGLMSAQGLRAVDDRLRELAAVDASYYCTHGLAERCACRKPRAGLLVRASAELDIDLSRSWMVGDRQSDCEAGRRVGCRTVLVAPRDGALLAAAHRIATTTPAARSLGPSGALAA